MRVEAKPFRVLLLLVAVATSLFVVGSGMKLEAFSLLILSQRQYRVEVAFPVLLFDAPVGIYNAGDGSNRLFVVEQAGLIWGFNNSRDVFFAELFLNISDRVLFGGEQGLLGFCPGQHYEARSDDYCGEGGHGEPYFDGCGRCCAQVFC